MRKRDLTTKELPSHIPTYLLAYLPTYLCTSIREHPKGAIIGTCDIWDTDYNTDNWEPGLMTIFVTWTAFAILAIFRWLLGILTGHMFIFSDRYFRNFLCSHMLSFVVICWQDMTPLLCLSLCFTLATVGDRIYAGVAAQFSTWYPVLDSFYLILYTWCFLIGTYWIP